MRHRSSWSALAILALLASVAPAQLPDIIVGEIPSTWNWGSANNFAAFSVATTACNIGNATMPWEGPTNQHPIIATNMFRMKDGRFEQLGQAWVKHGFASLNNSVCLPCQGNPGIQQWIGIGCSDPYGNQQNGIQSDLAPKSEVNAATGYFPFPFNGTPAIPPTTGRRLHARHVDLDPALNAGANYFIEVHYVTPNDVAGAKNLNNASYRRVNVAPNGGSYNISFSGANPTQREKAAVQAWHDYNPNVVIQFIDIPNDGRLILGFLATDNGNGTTHYEYALHNLCSDRCVQGVSIALPAGTVVSGAGFKDVDYHSNEPAPYSLTDWTQTTGATSVSWATDSYATNQYANALRWGTLYNYRFDSTLPPGDITLTLFKPGVPTTIVVPSPLPAFTLAIAGGPPAAMEPDVPQAVTVQATNVVGQPDTSSGLLYASINNGPFVPSALTSVGGNAFSGQIPAAPCFQTVRWYVSLAPLGGGSPILLPLDAPAITYQTEAISSVLQTIVADDMEVPVQGWSVVNAGGLTDGPWDAAPGIPIGGGDRGDPATAFGGSGKCFLTDNVDGDSDVDNGETRLTTPAFNLTGFADARVRVQIWYDNAFSAGSNDSMVVQISNNNGGTWTTMETFNTSPGTWVEHRYRVGEFVALASQMKVRFIASDVLPGHVVEAGVDSFRVEVCPPAPYLGVAGIGNVGVTIGGPYDVLTINGSAGGASRRVNVGIGQSFSFDVAQPPGNAIPSHFALFGMAGIPAPSAILTLPLGIGDMCVVPCVIDPLNPFLLMLADNFPIGGCTPVLPSTPAPWSILIPGGLGFPLDVTIQAVIGDSTAPIGLSVTNGVILRIS